eukprot:augustus_masked-scaffold_8-processed-gene-10.12-mRNA-1 protein AED:0.41 eAED:0.42 QI:0/-1/0/1/-1/1/1/0/1314
MSDTSISDEESKMHTRPLARKKSNRSKSNVDKAIEELRRNKNMGLTRAQEYEMEQLRKDKKIYDVVDEAEYQEIVRQRREGAAFVVDDDGTGYIDHGEEVLFGRKVDPEEEEDEEDVQPEKTSKKRKNVAEYSLKKFWNKAAKKSRKQGNLEKNKLIKKKEQEAEKELENLFENDLMDASMNEAPKAEKSEEQEFTWGDDCIEEECLEEKMEKEINTKIEEKPITEETNIEEPVFLTKLKSKPIEVMNVSNQEPKIELRPTNKSEINGKFKFLVIDVYEDVFSVPGTLFLMGKTKNNISCCIEVQNLEQTLYFHLKGDIEQAEAKVENIHEEIIRIVYKYFAVNKCQIKGKIVEKAMHFSHPVVAKGTSAYYMVRIPGKYYKYPNKSLEPYKIEGEHFDSILNSRQSFTESFLLAEKIKCPQWLEVELDPSKRVGNRSWCKTYYKVKGRDAIKVVKEDITSNVAFSGLNMILKTELNEVTQTQEVISICLEQMKNESLNQTEPTGKQPNLKSYYLTTLNSQISKTGHRFQVLRFNTEKDLLKKLIEIISLLDPDFVLSHSLVEFDLPFILGRCKKLGINTWSKLTRLKFSLNKLDKYALKNPVGVLPGRLWFDSTLLAKELVLNQKDYSLATLNSSFKLSKSFREVKAQDFTRLPLLEAELLVQMKLFEKLGCFTLSKEMTKLAGNLWRRTLTAGRAERVEYLLLHELEGRSLLLPEKIYSSNERKGKSSYTGGLVLDPKVGLYDTFVLLLDFNSLYPSIIQEYNICFTTIHEEVEEESLDEFDFRTHLDEGILPGVLRVLVQRRKAVKQMLAKTGSRTLEVRQKALKLIANSMYGCLGFKSSRFYNPNLAKLVTFQGRQILKSSVHLVQGLKNLTVDVVYGDTDSLMINTNIKNEATDSNMTKVKSISLQIRKAVSKNYRVLELGEDGIFSTLLLLKKKKYAAVLYSKESRGVKEIKGLDLVRRDWSLISKRTGTRILDVLLSLKYDKEESVDKIYDILEGLKRELETLRFTNRASADTDEPPRKYIKAEINKCVITRGVTKSLTQYKGVNPNSLPHIVVARRLAQSGKLKVASGAFIPYLFCLTPDKKSLPYHPEEVLSQPDLEIDVDYYLKNQIIPPVGRLLHPIEEINMKRIHDILGVTYNKTYHYDKDDSGYNYEDEEHVNVFNYGKITKEVYEEMYYGCKPVSTCCTSCSAKVQLTRSSIEVYKRNQALLCPGCGKSISIEQMCNSFLISCREAMRSLYSVETDSVRAYRQLRYFRSVVDQDLTIMGETSSAENAKVKSIYNLVNDNYLKRCSMNYVSPGLFSKVFKV